MLNSKSDSHGPDLKTNQQRLLKESKNWEMITNIEEHQQRFDLWCGKSRVEASVELGPLTTLLAV
jgi:hypothetical protein